MEHQFEQTKQNHLNQKLRSNIWEFLRPTIRKIIFFLILVLPVVSNFFIEFFQVQLIPARFVLLHMCLASVFKTYVLLTRPVASIFGGYAYAGGEEYIFAFYYLVLASIIWLLACFVKWIWTKFFNIFKTKAKSIESLLVFVFLIAFLSIFIIWPLLITKNAVVVEKDTRKDFLMPEGEVVEIFKLQQVILKNQSIMPVLHALPSITICMYDRDKQDSKFVMASYDGLDKSASESIRLVGREEKKFFLTVIENIRNNDNGGYYDQFLIFYDAGWNNRDFCEELREKDIKGAEKVEIIRQPLNSEKEKSELSPPVTTKDVNIEGIERCEEISFENRRYYPTAERYDCYRELALKTLNIAVCDYFDNDIRRDICKIKIAAKKADSEICGQIMTKENKLRCQMAIKASQDGADVCEQIRDWKNLLERSYCFFFLAEARLEPNLCENIEISEPGFFNQSDCYRDIAFVKRDFSICDKIKNSDCKIRIILQIQDPSLCEGLDDFYKEDCYTELAKLSKNPLLCGRISKKFGEQDECYDKVAKVAKDESICDFIAPSSELATKVCYPDENKPSLPPTCYYFPTIKDFCYRDVAAIKKDISVCDQVPENVNKDLCYEAVLETIKDISICTKMKDPYKKDFCYITIAVNQKDSTICSDVIYKKDRCYTQVAEVNNDVFLCDQVSQKDDCYHDVAIFVKDVAVCDLIQDIQKKQSCRQDVYGVQRGEHRNRKIL